jgi:hypothetical protein
VSFLALLVMAFLQMFAYYQTWLPKSISFRICLCIWSVVVLILVSNFLLMQLMRSFALIVAFQLALLSIFLVINLIIHPLNLAIASRREQESQMSRATTQSLWLLLHSLSFTLLALMLVWESTNQRLLYEEENMQLMHLQLAAYSVHCIANPMIAILREPLLAKTIGEIVFGNSGTVVGNPSVEHWTGQSHYFSPEEWLLQHIPPPPPYVSRSGSAEVSTALVEVVSLRNDVRTILCMSDAVGNSDALKAYGVAPAPAHRSGSLSSI